MGVVCELDYNETDFDLDVLLDNSSIIEDGSQIPAEDSDISAYSDVANLDCVLRLMCITNDMKALILT